MKILGVDRRRRVTASIEQARYRQVKEMSDEIDTLLKSQKEIERLTQATAGLDIQRHLHGFGLAPKVLQDQLTHQSLMERAMGGWDTTSKAIAALNSNTDIFGFEHARNEFLRAGSPFDIDHINGATTAAFLESATGTLALTSRAIAALGLGVDTIAAEQARNDVVRSAMGFGLEESRLAMQTALASADLHQADLARAMGPLAELRAVGALSGSDALSMMLESYEARFRRMEIPELSSLASNNVQLGTLGSLYGADILKAADIHSAWLSVDSPFASARDFVELNALRYAVDSLDPFSDLLAKSLRADLGDWRDTITFPVLPENNFEARSRFYAERGFRAELTDFPPAVFEEAIALEEFDDATMLVAMFGEPIETSASEDASAFERTSAAHFWIMRFEYRLREIIDARMTEAFGPNWARHQTSHYDRWLEKRKKAERGGRASPRLIDYAEFGEYQSIIERRDNWPHFKDLFHDSASFRESMQRLYYPRNETMHCRPLTHEDLLLLFTELKRLGRAFRSRR